MTLQSSGAISMSNIAAEFGGSTPHSLSEYYRGGANVPSHSNTAGIPTGGAISMSNFYGKSNTAPTDNAVSGTLGTTSPALNKYGLTRRGASTSNAVALFTNSPTPYGSISDSSFTNPAGSATFTLRQFWCNVNVFFSGHREFYISLAGNYAGQTFNGVTGRSTFTCNGISMSCTSGTDALGNSQGTITGTHLSGETYWFIGSTNTTIWGTSGSFSATFS
tara:strand:+ start:315 stop:974 length:660 start_codon:yes stop_codon:yes gene_type:complete